MIRFADPARENAALARPLEQAMKKVLASGTYVLGEEVARLEAEIAAYVGVRHAVGVGTGTGGIALALRSAGVARGDEVVVSAFTYFAAVEAIAEAGGTPRLVDCDANGETPASALREALSPKTRAIVVTSLHGRAIATGDLVAFAASRGVAVIEDACQAFGAHREGRRAGSGVTAGVFSFYPTKVLGGLGDGGMVVTDDAALADRVRSLRAHGARPDAKYVHRELGSNCRLDELQAAALRVKLAALPDAIAARRRIAAAYARALERHRAWLTLPSIDAGDTFYAFAVMTPARDALREHLARAGIEAPVHFPVPLHRQPAFVELGDGPVALPGAETRAATVLSLPCHPSLTESEVARVVAAIDTFGQELR